MKYRYSAPALTYAFAGKKKSLGYVIRDDNDPYMASYLLDRHAETINAVELGHGLIHLADKPIENNADWTRTAALLLEHRAAPDISHALVGSSLITCAIHGNVALTRELLKLPQIAAISPSTWDHILFECLPLGDPEKKRIEKRNFTDRDGNPEILKMVREAIGKTVHEMKPSPPQEMTFG